ncbi:MAG TPA: hypothetical protein VD970_04030 [Acetobacteraceae bacterium]|nr:hypothetical protein [Acetobacteraceae bacterium]
MGSRRFAVILLVAGILLAGGRNAPAASDPFGIIVSIPEEVTAREFSSLRGLATFFSPGVFSQFLSTYDVEDSVLFNFSLRGVRGQAFFPDSSSTLFVSIPGARITTVIEGDGREDSAARLRALLLSQSFNDLLGQGAVRTTPTDPVAGNPGSLMGQMVASDFNRALSVAVGMQPGGGLGFGVGFGFSQFTARGGVRSSTTSLPLNHTFTLSTQDQLEVDVPITWIQTGGANAYAAQLGLMWRRQVTEDWILQPAIRVGLLNSDDMGTSAGLYQVGLTSVYRFALPWSGMRLIVANQITHATSFVNGLSDYSTNYAQTNTVFRNGLALSIPVGFQVMGRALQANVFAIDTRYTGDPVFIRHYQEFGAFVGLGGASRGQAGFTILTGDRGTRGFSLRAAWQF